MKKKYKLDEIDCANCALKLETAIKGVEGVSGAKVNYMTQKMTLEADESVFDRVEKDVLAVCKKMEPDMDVTPA
jgi:copper chaperone CopZ